MYSPNEIYRQLVKIEDLNNKYMSTDDLSKDEEDELLAQMDIEVALAVKMITTFTGNKINAKTAEKMVRFHLDQLKQLLVKSNRI